MKNFFRSSSMVVILLGFAFSLAISAGGVFADDDPVVGKGGTSDTPKSSVTGYVQHRSEFGLQSPHRYSMSEFLGVLEARLQFNDKLSLNSVARVRYDGIFDLRNDFGRQTEAENALHVYEGELKELYVDYKPIDGVYFRLGKQMIIWGESDGLRLMDVINPLDLKWGFLTRKFEDIRVPLWSLRMNYDVPFLASNHGSLELVWIPGDFAKNEIAPAGAAWAPATPEFLTTQFGNLASAGLLPVLTDRPRAQTLANSRYGAKLAFNVGGVDMSLNYFNTYSDDAIFYQSGIGPAPPIPGFVGTYNLESRYPWKNVFGGTFNYDFGTIVARGEVAYETGHRFQNLTKSDWVEEGDYVKGMLGFDWFLGIPGFNGGRTIMLSGQVFDFHIVDYNNNIINLPYGYQVKKDEVVLTLLVNTGFISDTIKPEIFFAYDPTYKSYWINPKCEFQPGTNWRFEVGANWFGGDRKQTLPFAAFNSDDAAYVQLTRMF